MNILDTIKQKLSDRKLKKFMDFYGINTEGEKLPTEVAEYFKFFITKGRKLDSDPITDKEIAEVKKIMEKHEEEFNSMEIYRKWGCICVSTPSWQWACLAGRLWGVNLETPEGMYNIKNDSI